MATVDEQFVAYSRLVRPFPTRRLRDSLYQTLAGAASIQHRADMLLMDPPVTADEWTDALYEIGNLLETLADACDDALPMLKRLVEQAPGDHRRALDALVTMVRGLQAEAAREAGEAPTLRAA
jgi:Cdc6-like AAA superfamily ATPase